MIPKMIYNQIMMIENVLGPNNDDSKNILEPNNDDRKCTRTKG